MQLFYTFQKPPLQISSNWTDQNRFCGSPQCRSGCRSAGLRSEVRSRERPEPGSAPTEARKYTSLISAFLRIRTGPVRTEPTSRWAVLRISAGFFHSSDGAPPPPQWKFPEPHQGPHGPPPRTVPPRLQAGNHRSSPRAPAAPRRGKGSRPRDACNKEPRAS